MTETMGGKQISPNDGRKVGKFFCVACLVVEGAKKRDDFDFFHSFLVKPPQKVDFLEDVAAALTRPPDERE